MPRKKKNLEHPHSQLSTLDLIKKLIESKIPVKKDSPVDPSIPMVRPTPGDIEVVHIAIVLDGVVEEVLRAQNRLAALMLSEPKFIEFDPNEVYPKIGTKYEDGKFVDAEHQHEGHSHD